MMRVIGDKNQISEDVFDFMISYLPFPQKSIRSELAKLFSKCNRFNYTYLYSKRFLFSYTFQSCRCHCYFYNVVSKRTANCYFNMAFTFATLNTMQCIMRYKVSHVWFFHIFALGNFIKIHVLVYVHYHDAMTLIYI